MTCEYSRRYIGSDEEWHTKTCKADAVWTWYEAGKLIGMCHEHTRENWFFARGGIGVMAAPVSRVRGGKL